MKVFHRYQELPKSILNGVTVIGNFDGVHKGHQELFKRARAISEQEGQPFNVITFEPHPRDFFLNNDKGNFRITPLRSKLRLFSEIGIDNLFIFHFCEALRNLSGELFIEQILVDALKVSHIVVGEDYHFGRDRIGDIKTLQSLGLVNNFSIILVPIIKGEEGERYSSSLIREYIKQGDIKKAEHLLGHSWEIEGRVIKGNQLGRTIGFPTANIELKEYIYPKTGVYAVKVGFIKNGYQREWHNGVANFGTRPTVEGKGLIFETHIFDWDKDIYGERILIRLIEYLRPEIKVASLDILKQQIREDKACAQRILN